MASIQSINPADNTIIKSYELHDDDYVKNTIDAAQETFTDWSKESFEARSKLMYRLADLLIERKESYGELMTQEMGKTFASAQSEIEKCAWVCRYYADHASTFLKEEEVTTEAKKSSIVYRPLGIVLAVMPWNYPFWQVFRFAAPALMAGNVGILKHASNVPGCALAIQQVIEDAGFPKHAFSSLLIKSDQVEMILESKKVMAATLTGSGPAGSSVAEIAGSAIKKTVLELGGNDPYLILADADLDHAAKQCCESRLLNAGQSCIGAKRFIVVDAVYDAFLEKFTEEINKSMMGDPMQSVDLGPMARHDLRDEVHDQVVESVNNGAILHLGGAIPDHEGAYYPPTILTNVKPGMPAYDDEIFGPVASVIRVANEREAIAIANDSKFGLGACVFTQDLERGEYIAKNKLQAGCCFVNQYVKSDPRLPFGGIKNSGYGRELSRYGIREFVNIKTVWVN